MLGLLISPFAKIIGAIVLVGVLFGSGYYKGYSAEKERFDAFKAELAAQAKAQEIVNNAKKKQQETISKSIRSEYEAKLSALNSYYGGVRQQSSTNKLSEVSSTTFSVDGKTTNPVFVRQCAQTTLMLGQLQDWVLEVSKTDQ